MALSGRILCSGSGVCVVGSTLRSSIAASEMPRSSVRSLLSGELHRLSASSEPWRVQRREVSSEDSPTCFCEIECSASRFAASKSSSRVPPYVPLPVSLFLRSGIASFSRGRMPSVSKFSFRSYPKSAGSKQKSKIRYQIEDNEDPVVSTEWLAKRLSDVCVLDVRGHVNSYLVEEGVEKSDYNTDYDEYLEGHIPGAIFFSWVRDGVNSQTSVPVQLMTDINDFAPVMEAKGVSIEKPVVIYDNGDGLLAPRIWWALVLHGHPCVRVLDGGLKKWRDEGRPLELYEPCTLKVYADYNPEKLYPSLVASWKDLLSLVSGDHARSTSSEKDAAERVVVIDARDNAQYNGVIRRSKFAGRVPGAINIPRRSLLEPEGTFKSAEMQRQVFKDAGLDPESPTKLIAYCNGGVASCTVLLAWHRVQGNGSWANYDGSWNEWGNRDDLPVEK